jgi:hypothetical protein
MQTTDLWRSHHLYCSKIILLFVLLCCTATSTFAQLSDKANYSEHDEKPFYFGMTAGFNFAQYKLFHSKFFTENDSVKEITPLWQTGFQLGVVGNLKLSDFVDVRVIPSFVLREKTLKFKYYNDSEATSSFESVLFSMPLEFKFKSDRQENFRFYALLGGKFDYDFNANKNSRRTDDIIKVKAFDYGYNVGVGFEFYFPNFILSPEIKISNGLANTLVKNSAEITSLAIDKINTRMIILSLHLGG